MNTLRTIAPLVAGLMALLVLIQSADLVRCADEIGGALAMEHHYDGAALGLDHAPGATHGDDTPHPEGVPDCLCHVTFVSTATLLALPAPAEMTFVYPARAALLVDGETAPPGHVPLA